MSQTHSFTARIEGTGGGGAYVTVPFDVEEAFGKKRVKVRATFDEVPYRGSVTRMGGPAHILIVLKEIRERIGKEPGDEVRVTLEEDREPREVEIPRELREALAGDPEAAEAFDALAYTHRREYAQWVTEAKREGTRQDRATRTLERVREGRKLR